MNRRVLAIIPARSGSKGLADKNIKMLGNKPLMAYTIESAIKSKVFTKIILSTDSEKYAAIGKELGVCVPYLRPPHLATDTATSKDVVLDILKNEEENGFFYDDFIVLQPTSPFRDEKNIQEAYKLYLEKKANAIVSVCPADHSPYITNTLDISLSMDNFINEKILNKGRQQVETFYTLNGAIYISNTAYYKKHENFYYENCYAYIMNKSNSIDIDDELDFLFASFLLEKNAKEL